MNRNRGGAIAAFLEDLGSGDPVAWAVVGVVGVVAVAIGLFVLKTHFDLKREDEELGRRPRRKS